jgi:hypothetical protein
MLLETLCPGLEAELEGVEELVSRRGGEDSPSPRAQDVVGAVEVHDPKIWGFLSRKRRVSAGRLVGERVSSLCRKHGESLALDDLSSFQGHLEWLELHKTFLLAKEVGQ